MKSTVFAAALSIGAAWTTAAVAQPVEPQAAARYSAADIQAAVSKLRPIVQDGFATEAVLAAARSDLQILLARADQLTAVNAARTDAAAPAAAVQLEVRNLLAAIDGRLGRAPDRDRTGGVRVTRITALPVPDFDEGHVTADAANALRLAQANLGDQLRKTPPDAQRTEDLLVDMIVAEEKLAWHAGWPFTSNEVTELKGVLAEFAKIKEQAGKPGMVGTLNEIDRRIGEVYGRRRARGVSAINAQLSREADSVGRGTPAPFVIHRPLMRAGQRAVEQRLAELISSELGHQLQPGGPALMLLANSTRPFDEVAATSLRAGR